MSTPKTTPWKLIAIGFIILTVAFGAIAGAAVSQMTSLNNDKTNLQSQLDALKSQVAKDNQTITSLNSQITSLNGQVSSLQTQLSNLEKANVTAIFTWTSTGPFGLCPGLFCIAGSASVTDVAYANLGTITANNAILSVTFYSGNSGTGIPLCQVSVALGTIQGRTVAGLTNLSDSCDTGQLYQAASAVGTTNWS